MSTPDVVRRVEILAASIADGSSIEWQDAGLELSPREQRLLRNLRLIDTLAGVFRTLPAASDDGVSHDPAADEDPAGPLWGRLILLDRIGSGTSGDVFRAWDKQLRREVALKLLHVDGLSDAAANARVLQEARRLARIRHPHVVDVYGAERHEDRIGLWMELVQGPTLDAVIADEGPMSPETAAKVGADLGGALGAVHAAGLLHRDVKAQNVVREYTGRVVLMDLGAGEEMGSGSRHLAGTPLYLAPEQLRGDPASVASDVYSLGVLLFHLLTGQFPVGAESIEALRHAHRGGSRRTLTGLRPDVPVALARVVERALAPAPSDRFESAAAMEAALRQWIARPVAAPGAASWRTWIAAGLVAAAVIGLVTAVWPKPSVPAPPAQLTSIAVLPLTFVSGQSVAPDLSLALTDQLITTIGEVRALRVTALTSVRRFEQTRKPIAAIAAELGVGSVLEGSILIQPGGAARGDDPRVRVNVRLIRAGTDVELWSDSFDRPLSDVLALERDIARAVAQSVRAQLTTHESTRLAQRSSANGPAQRAYLEGISYLAQNRRGAEVRPALDALQRAIVLDPSFVSPYAAVARTYLLLAGDGEVPQEEASAAARAAAERALELDPDLADAHVALADVSFYYDWDWTKAEAEYNRAIALDGSGAYARRQYANLLAALGRPDAARQQADQAVALDPLTADVLLTAGVMAYYQRHYDEARDTLRRVIAMDPRFPGAYRTLARIEEARGNIGEAINLTDRALRLSDYVPARAAALSLRAQAGQQTRARQGLTELQTRLAAEHRTLSAPYEAYVRLSLGERDTALDLLSRAVASRDQAVLWIRVDPRLDSLRTDSRFQALETQLGHP